MKIDYEKNPRAALSGFVGQKFGSGAQLLTVSLAHEIRNKYRKAAESYIMGYCSRKIDGIVSDYNGKYGMGYVIITPNHKSTYYCHIEYWT